MVLATSLFFNLFCSYTICTPTFAPPLASLSEPGSRPKSMFTDPNRPRWPVVWTHTGNIQGYSLTTRSGREVYAFEGVPFAEPPVGNLRFRNPIPKRRSLGLINLGINARQPCIHTETSVLYKVRGREDCLYLNVYTPTISQTSRLPVIVWIYGGAYFGGNKESYGPSYIMDQNVVFVTFNYRVGVFGFLTTGDKASPGNYGLKDQHLALQWVRDNIHFLGGDPELITLMGQSAGAASVHLHMISSLSRGKFVRAISLSGTAFCNWVVASNREVAGIKLAKSLKCPTRNSFDMVNCLRRIGPNILTGAQTRLFEWLNYPAVNFGPTVERYIDEGTFLTQTPDEHYATGDVAKVPWIVGFLRNEGNFYNTIMMALGWIAFPEFDRHFNRRAPLTLDFRGRGLYDVLISRKIRNFYFGNQPITYRNLKAQGAMYGDRYFLSGIHRGMMQHMQIAPTYGYVFNYMGQFSTLHSAAGMTRDEAGISHFDDMQYYFNSSLQHRSIVRGHPDAPISKLMVNLVTNFARLGEPLINVQGKEPRIWEPMHWQNIKILSISNTTQLILFPNSYLDRIRFWNNLDIPL